METAFRQKTSANLYRAAWAVEVVAVLMGLGISVAVGFDGFESLRTSDRAPVVVWINILIAAAPFFLVALVELTKIPLSGAAYYAAQWYWKVMFTFGLIFVALVTFETMFNGLERNFASLKFSMDLKMDEYTLLQERSTDRVDERSVAEELTLDSIEAAYNARLTVISDDFDAAVAAIDKKYESQRKATSDEFIGEKRADKNRRAQELADLRQRHRDELRVAADRAAQARAQAETSLENKRKTIQQQYKEKSAEIVRLNQQLSEMSFLSRSRGPIEEQVEAATTQMAALSAQLSELINQSGSSEVSSTEAAMRTRHQQEVASLSADLKSISDELETALGERKALDENLNNTIRQEKGPITQKAEEQRAEAASWRRAQLSDLENRTETIDDLNLEIAALAAQITELRGEINSEGRGNQVYRMAASFYDKDKIAELSPRQIATIATVWFGSLATIVAFTGILLAFGSYAVKAEPRAKPTERRLVPHLRMLIAAIKLHKRKPTEVQVEVVKEVQVIKKVEVPGPERIVDREVKVREEVFVPVPATPAQLEALISSSNPQRVEEVAA